MEHITPRTRVAGKLSRIWSTLDRLIFREPDLDALRRGWEVHGTGRGKRVYRDPRWHGIVECDECQGSGMAAAHPCPGCDGRGAVRRTDADSAALR